MAFKSDLVDVGPPPCTIVPQHVPPPGVLRSIQPTPEQQAAALAAVRGQPAPAGTAPPRPLVNKSTKTSTPQRNSTLEGTTTLFALQSRINVLENAVEASDRQLASEKASRAAVESQLRALQTQRTEKDLEEFVLDQQPLGDDLGAQLAAAQAKCTALEQEGERLRRVSELVGAFEIRADEADLENVKLKAAAGEGERNRSELMDKLAASAARLEQKDAALDALRSEKNASESTAQEHAMEMAEDVRTAQQRSATLQEELDRAKADLDQAKLAETQRAAELKEAHEKLAQQATELEQMAVHRNGFTESTNAMHAQLTDQKTRNGELSGEVDALRSVNQALKEQRALFIQALSSLGLGHVKEAVLSGDISKLAAATPQDGAAAGEAMEIDRDAGAIALVRLGAPPNGTEEYCRACKEPSRREKHTCGRQRNAPAPVGERPSKAAKTSANPKGERATMPSASNVTRYLDGLLVMFGAVDADFENKLHELRRLGRLPAKSSPGEPSTLTLGHFHEILKLDGHDDRLEQPNGTFMTPRDMLLAHVKRSFDKVEESNANAVYQELFRWLTNQKFKGTSRHDLPQWDLQLDKTILQIVLALDPTRHAEIIRDMSDDDA